ncbi:MAG: DUF3786 domain-containing protein [Thermodesulfobacteriota bacterium]
MPVTPFDIVKRTPKSNCGDCGYPSCLAFGVAVTTQGDDPGKCPHLNREGLQLDSSPKAGDVHQRDLELVRHLKGKIAGLDFTALAPKLGGALSPSGAMLLSYLGRQTAVSGDGILLDGKEPEDPRDQILLYNYLAFGGGEPPAGDWIGMESMPNSISKVKTLETYCENRLADLLDGAARERITAAAGRAGGSLLAGGSTDLSLLVPVLPMLPLAVHFWKSEPEDGFAARVKILFDRTATGFLDIESLVFCAERMAERFEELLAG